MEKSLNLGVVVKIWKTEHIQEPFKQWKETGCWLITLDKGLRSV